MSTTNPNTIWTPDFFWEAPPDAREHIEHFNGLSQEERCEAAYLRGEYFTSVNQSIANQSPKAIKEFAEFVMYRVAIEGMVKAPRNAASYASIQSVSYSGLAENGQSLTIGCRQRLRTTAGKDWLEPERLLTFEEQQARDEAEFERNRRQWPEELTRVAVRTDSEALYEWPKIPDLHKDWPLVEVSVNTRGVHLGVAYADYQRGHTLSIQAVPERIEQLRTFIEQFPLSPAAVEGDNLPKQS